MTRLSTSALAALAVLFAFASTEASAQGLNFERNQALENIGNALQERFAKRGSGQLESTGGGGNGTATLKFIAPKADRDAAPKVETAKIVLPKSPRGESDAGSGPVTAQFVSPKAPRDNGPVLANLDASRPARLAPADTTPDLAPAVTKVSLPSTEETEAPSAAPAPVAPSKILPASKEEVALAHFRAAQRYGYDHGSYTEDYGYGDGHYVDAGYDQGYSDASPVYDYNGGYEEGCY